MRIHLFLTLFVFSVVLPSHAAAEPPSPMPVRISVSFRGTPLPKAIEESCAKAGLKCSIEAPTRLPDVPVNVNARDITLEPLIRLLLKQADAAQAVQTGLVYARSGDTFILARRAVETARIEIPIGTVLALDPIQRSTGPARLLISRLEVKPAGQILVEFQAEWPGTQALGTKAREGDFFASWDLLLPSVRLKSGQVVPVYGQEKREERPSQPGGNAKYPSG